MPFLSVESVSRNFDGVLAVDDVSFEVKQAETVSIIGPNGAGKTTLFNLITGLDLPSRGRILLDGQSLSGLPADKFAFHGIARTFQHGRVFGNLTVLENVLIGAHARRRAARSDLPPVAFFAELVSGLVPLGARAEEKELRARAHEILARFGDRLLPRLHEPAFTLSFANRRRLEIARALALQPRLLLLDEPTAGMNPAETFEMLDLIGSCRENGLTILLIEHKLSLVMQLSDRVVVMDNGKKIAHDVPERIRNDPRVIEAYLGHSHQPPAEITRETDSSVQPSILPPQGLP